MGRPRKEKVELSGIELIASKIGEDWKDILAELQALDGEGLKGRVTSSSQAIHDAEQELNQNEAYLRAKEDAKLLSAGLRDVRKRQKAVIKTCLELRKERGEA